ncbi:MAG: hypothetical protein V2I33_22785, partial [Kangiellaceae bacterium]|nr:hypothetical protein [Kangiellaceae bacterium]
MSDWDSVIDLCLSSFTDQAARDAAQTLRRVLQDTTEDNAFTASLAGFEFSQTGSFVSGVLVESAPAVIELANDAIIKIDYKNYDPADGQIRCITEQKTEIDTIQAVDTTDGTFLCGSRVPGVYTVGIPVINTLIEMKWT